MSKQHDYAKDNSAGNTSSLDMSTLEKSTISMDQSIMSLQDSLDVSTLNLDVYTVKQCEDEIKRCKTMNEHFRRLTYMIAINSGMHAYVSNINFYLVSDLMKKEARDFAALGAFAGLAWTIKPIYGWISDSIYPFKLRFKPYVTLM